VNVPTPRQTFFLPAGRSAADVLRAQAAKLASSPVVTAIFQAAGGAVAILNGERQVVAVNQAGLDLIGEGAGEALGLRPGEALGCTRAADGPDGCGTGAGCASCGAALAIVVADHRDRAEERDCAITVKRGDRRIDLDLRVRAAPLDLDGERFTLLSISDISADRRRQALEQSFAGDVHQRMAALRSAAASLAEGAATPEAIARVRALVQQLDRSMQVARAIAAGIGGQVEPSPRLVVIADELAQLAEIVDRSQAIRGRRLEILPCPPGEVMMVDSVLLQHVLVAMTLNALEASRAGGRVRVDVDPGQALVTFQVWNAGAIPAAATHRIFQRHYTTKGPGRGNGTWSMKVVGEELLRGEVGFRTSEAGGTTFWLTLPRRPFARA
jgi:signal transduction histidine kinase